MSETVIALDVGARRIGIAVGEGTFAFPHSTLARTTVRDDVATIVAIAREAQRAHDRGRAIRSRWRVSERSRASRSMPSSLT